MTMEDHDWDTDEWPQPAPIAPIKRGRPPRIIAPLLPRGNSTHEEQDAGTQNEQDAR